MVMSGSNEMWSEEQWQYLGQCIHCGADCYGKDGEFKSTTDMDCLCTINSGYGSSSEFEAEEE